MAIENAKTLNVRIRNKYDSYENWVASGLVLEAGEIATAYTTIDVTVDNGKAKHPALLMKVGDGTNTFANLPWLSAKAADVAEWAKAATKPGYAINEITGGGDLSKLTTTAKADLVTAINEVRQAVEVGGTGSVVTLTSETVDNVTTYTLKQGETNLGTIVVTDFTNNIAAVLGASSDEAGKATVYGALAAAAAAQTAANNAQSAADGKVASVTNGDASVTIGGTATAPTVSAKISANGGNALTIEEDGLMVTIPTAAEYTIEKAAEAGEYAAVYKLMKDGTQVGASINIPKDLVVKSGSVDENGNIVLVLNDEANTEIVIPAASLIEYVTSGSAVGDMVVIAVSDDHKVTATITDGTIIKEKLHIDVQTSLGKADTALQEANIVTGENNGTIKVGTKEVAVAGLGTAAYKNEGDFDTAGAAADVLGNTDDTAEENTVYGAKAAAAAASQAVTDLDNSLAAIAKTGSTDDLVQGEMVLIFDCGTSAV